MYPTYGTGGTKGLVDRRMVFHHQYPGMSLGPWVTTPQQRPMQHIPHPMRQGLSHYLMRPQMGHWQPTVVKRAPARKFYQEAARKTEEPHRVQQGRNYYTEFAKCMRAAEASRAREAPKQAFGRRKKAMDPVETAKWCAEQDKLEEEEARRAKEQDRKQEAERRAKILVPALITDALKQEAKRRAKEESLKQEQERRAKAAREEAERRAKEDRGEVPVDATNPYAALRLERPATVVEVQEAYRKQALRWHPDKNRECDKLATANFRTIKDAAERILKAMMKPEDLTWILPKMTEEQEWSTSCDNNTRYYLKKERAKGTVHKERARNAAREYVGDLLGMACSEA